MDFLNMLAVASPQAGQSGQQPNQLLAFLPIILMFVIFYFLLIRPQQKRQQELEKMLGELKKGDKVVTTGGLIGTIVGVKEKEVVVKVGDDGVKLELLRSAINQIIKS
jgi:preprotein translocase subunit YajC